MFKPPLKSSWTYFITCNLRPMNDNIMLPTKEISYNDYNWVYVLIKISHLSSFNALNLLKVLFIGIASVECIVVPSILNVVFHVYVNFIIIGFKGLGLGVSCM
jgi:hypothetical protein